MRIDGRAVGRWLVAGGEPETLTAEGGWLEVVLGSGEAAVLKPR